MDRKDFEKRINSDSEQMAIVVWIPKRTEKLKLKVRVDGVNMKTNMSYEDIEDAREKYLEIDPTDDAFVRYTLSPLFKQYLEEYGTDTFDLDHWEKYREEHKAEGTD